MVIEGAIGPILVFIFIILVGIAVYLMALPTILESKGIDIKKLNAKINRKKRKNK